MENNAQQIQQAGRMGIFPYSRMIKKYVSDTGGNCGPQIGEAYKFKGDILTVMSRKIFNAGDWDCQIVGPRIDYKNEARLSVQVADCSVLIELDKIKEDTTLFIFNIHETKRQEALKKLEEVFT